MSTQARPRTFPREFKLELMRQWDAGERTCAQLMREHGIGQSVLYRWHAAYEQHGAQAFSPAAVSEVEALARRVAELERALGKVTLENQLLKRGRELGRSRSSTR